MLPGDYFVARTDTIPGWFIRLFTRSKWNHAGILVSHKRTVEAFGRRVRFGRPTAYRTVLWSGETLTEVQRQKIIVEAIGDVGKGYGWADIIALGLWTWGIRWAWLDRIVANQKRLICSQLVAQCYADAGITLIPGKRPQQVTPGDLADHIRQRPIPTNW